MYRVLLLFTHLSVATYILLLHYDLLGQRHILLLLPHHHRLLPHHLHRLLLLHQLQESDRLRICIYMHIHMYSSTPINSSLSIRRYSVLTLQSPRCLHNHTLRRCACRTSFFCRLRLLHRWRLLGQSRQNHVLVMRLEEWRRW